MLITQVDKIDQKGTKNSTALKMFISAVLILFNSFFRCSYFNRSWLPASRDGRFLIVFTNSCIVNGSVDGSNWGRGGSNSFGHGVS